jgi:hypothetical protein
MPFLVRHRQLVSIATHLGIAAAAYVAAFLLRFDLEPHPRWLWVAGYTLPLPSPASSSASGRRASSRARGGT